MVFTCREAIVINHVRRQSISRADDGNYKVDMELQVGFRLQNGVLNLVRGYL